MKWRFIILLFVGFVSSCRAPKQSVEVPKPDGKRSYEEFAATIRSYPYEAPQLRKDKIIKNYPELQIGMSKDQVAGLIGEPDFSRVDYGPKGPGEKWQGSSWTYYLYTRSNLANNFDPCVYVRFGTDDRVNCITPSNIEGLTEKCSRDQHPIPVGLESR